MHAHTQTRAFSILYHASAANLSRTFFPIAKYCCLQFWSLRGVLSAHWGHISSEKRFVSIHKDLQHACFLTLAGCVKCQNGNCDVGSFCLRKVSRVFLEKSDFCFVLGSFFFFFFFFFYHAHNNKLSHNRLDSLGIISECSAFFCQIQWFLSEMERCICSGRTLQSSTQSGDRY